MSLKAGTVVDRYTVEEVLGQGGIAVVYKVRHNTLQSSHALKVLTLTSNAIRQRLIQEGRVQASLRHPNILSVTDIVEVDGAPGLIMEYVEGPTLENLLRDEGRLPFERAERIALGIIAGVAEAHNQGLIHRDLKPANVLLAKAGGSFVPKVADFGLVKLLSDSGDGLSSTRAGVMMGTPRYMAPEQMRDAKNVDRRADIFSLGAVLYELVTGRMAFPGDDLVALMNNITQGIYIRPRTLVPDLPESVEEAICGAMEIDRDKRISDCQRLMATWTGGDETDSRVFLRPRRSTAPVALAGLDAPDRAPAEPESIAVMAPPAEVVDPAEALPPAAPAVPRPRRSSPAIERPSIRALARPNETGSFPPQLSDQDTAVMIIPSSVTAKAVAVELAAQQTAARAAAARAAEPVEAVAEPEPTRRGGPPLWAVGVGGALLLALFGALGLGAMFLWQKDGPDEAPVAAAVEPPAEPPPSPAPEPTPAPPPEPTPPAPAEVAPPAKAEPKAKSETKAERAPPRKPAEPPGTVTIVGESDGVRLRKGKRVQSPGANVPPGAYEVVAPWEADGSLRAVGTVTVESGGSHTIKCRKASLICKSI